MMDFYLDIDTCIIVMMDIDFNFYLDSYTCIIVMMDIDSISIFTYA